MPGRGVALIVMLLSGCLGPTAHDPEPEGTSVALQVIPSEITETVPGQRLVFIIAMDPQTPGPVSLAALVADRTASVRPSEVQGGQLAEVVVDIPSTAERTTLTVTIAAHHGGQSIRRDIPIQVGEPVDFNATRADAVVGRFVSWLETEHPELGVGRNASWYATLVRPANEIRHNVWYNATWEWGIRWQEAPGGWAEMYLRERFVETAPSMAWRIDSVADNGTTPRPVAPPAQVWR